MVGETDEKNRTRGLMSDLACEPRPLHEETVRITINGEPMIADKNDTVAVALMSAGRRSWRHTQRGRLRGVFCGVGYCFDCLVVVDGVQNVRACVTRVREGIVIDTKDNP